MASRRARIEVGIQRRKMLTLDELDNVENLGRRRAKRRKHNLQDQNWEECRFEDFSFRMVNSDKPSGAVLGGISRSSTLPVHFFLHMMPPSAYMLLLQEHNYSTDNIYFKDSNRRVSIYDWYEYLALNILLRGARPHADVGKETHQWRRGLSTVKKDVRRFRQLFH
jgi:hypothetical protein